MYRLLLFITTLLISLSGFAQTPSDSLQQVRKAQIEKAREAARAKAQARAEERARMEANKKDADNVKKDNEAEKKTAKKVEKEEGKKDNKIDSKKGDKERKSDAKEERKREEKLDARKKAEASKKLAEKQDTVKRVSIRERNKKDTTIAKSKYGPGTFGWRGNVGATIAWSDYSERENKMGSENWGFVLNGGMGYRFNHIAYVGITLEIEAIELLAFSPTVDFVVSAPSPVAPFVELTAGPYISYDDYRKWVFQPRFGLSYRGKQNKIMRFGFGLRMYDDAFDSDTFRPQYAASYTVEF
ncbi:MAG: hypothetical protein KBT22_11125 [Bacteroidales bacterium]|nr:hypothetical protein [Candidatus Scybalocola fimicaballi]